VLSVLPKYVQHPSYPALQSPVLPDVHGQELDVRKGRGRGEVDLVNVLLLVDDEDEQVNREEFEP